MPKQFKWNDKYSVSVPSLDVQHKRFFEITNEILVAVDRPFVPDLKEKLTLLTVELGRYALHHLSYEEECMRSHNFEGFNEHLEIHDAFREKVKIYLNSLTKADTDVKALAKEVAEFAQSWLSKHILSKDKEYVECLTKANVK